MTLENLLKDFGLILVETIKLYSAQREFFNSPNSKFSTAKDTLSDSDVVNSLNIDVVNNQLVVSINSYWINIENGRKKGAKNVPLKVIIDWIKKKKILGRDKKGKFISVTTLAFLIQKGIKKNGIPPRRLFSKALEDVKTYQKFYDKYLNEYIDFTLNKILIKLK